MIYPIPMTQRGAVLRRQDENGDTVLPFLVMPPVRQEPITYPVCKFNSLNVDTYRNWVTVSQKTVSAYTFYCDSEAGGGNHSGDGTRQNPFRNICDAMNKLACLVNATCCYYFVLKVKGVVDYAVRHDAYVGASFQKRVIVTNWDGASAFNLEVETSYQSSTFIHGFTDCIFYDLRIRHYTTGPQDSGLINVATLSDCPGCEFLNCTVEIVTNAIDCYMRAINLCHGALFYDCDITISIIGADDYVSYCYGVNRSNSCSLVDTRCTLHGNGSSTAAAVLESTGFRSYRSSTVVVNENSQSRYTAGMQSCSTPFIVLSTLNVTGSDSSYYNWGVNGVCDCRSAQCYEAYVTAECKTGPEGRLASCAFAGNQNARFYTCTGIALCTGEAETKQACGFKGNTGAVYRDCTTSEQICTGDCDEECDF
mgnify:CR=1 FL=1